MIDLGDELDGYDGEKPPPKTYTIEDVFKQREIQWNKRPTPTGTMIPLADLQKQGFNREPPWPGYDPDAVTANRPNPFLPIPLKWPDIYLRPDIYLPPIIGKPWLPGDPEETT